MRAENRKNLLVLVVNGIKRKVLVACSHESQAGGLVVDQGAENCGTVRRQENGKLIFPYKACQEINEPDLKVRMQMNIGIVEEEYFCSAFLNSPVVFGKRRALDG